jgi:hypothetical protein
MPRFSVMTLACALLLVGSAPAMAAQRYAAPGGTTAGACPSSAPCALGTALDGAASGDEIVVAPGDYVVTTGLSPTVPLDVHGIAGQPRPRIVGSSSMTSAALSFKAGGTLRHLAVGATSTVGGSALVLQNAVADDLVLSGATGETAKLVGAPGVTVLRDSAIRMAGGSSSDSALKLTDGPPTSSGDIALVNVTVDAAGGQAIGVRCLTSTGQTTIVNSIVRGVSHDIDASSAGVRCTVSTSDFRGATSPGVTAGAGNISADPQYGDAAGGNLRPLAGSPVIDAGAPDARLGTTDLDGHARTRGAAPDMGAHEFDAGDPPSAASPTEFPAPPAAAFQSPAAAPGPAPLIADPTLPASEPLPAPTSDALAPALGHSVVLAPATGTVLVRRPGSAAAVVLQAGALVPVGSTIDTTHGTVALQSAVDGAGRTQTGRFWGGRFVVGQPKGGNGMVELRLTGGSFAGCPRATAAGARAARSRKPPRRLWGSDQGGRFRTRGRGSVATVRGTRWLTEDRCEGTLTRVAQGAVAVRDLRAERTVVVRAGHAYLARR